MDPAPGLVVVGHLTLDINEGGYLLGGAAYAALTAARLGYHVGLLTSYGPDLQPEVLLEDVSIVCQPAPTSTVFRNVYRNGRREQTVVSQALPLDRSHIPSSWQGAPVLLAPMMGEVGPDFLDAFLRSQMGACPQGWMRQTLRGGRVTPAPWTWAGEGLGKLDCLVLSVDDLEGNTALASGWASSVTCLVLTRGGEGVWLYYKGACQHVPPFPPARVVDPTGAGDAFASAFMLEWIESGSPELAARFASMVASCVVEAKGLEGVPSRERVNEMRRQLKFEVN